MYRSVAACCLGVLMVAGFTSCQEQPQVSTAAEQAPQPSGVVALGRLEPRDRVTEVSVAGDERLARVLVKQGQFVKAGDVLAYLESYDTRLAVRDRAAAQLRDAEAQLRGNTQQAGARINEADLRLRQLDVVPARDVEVQEARVRAASADLDLAMTDLERVRALQESGLIPRQEFDRQVSLVARLRAAMESEQATLQRLKTLGETDRKIAEAQLGTRRAELESLRVSAQLDSLKQALNVAQADLRASIIRAPSDGQIIEIIANPGEAVLGRVILRMGDVSQMYVLAEVYETDVARVHTGQRVEVSSPSLSKPLTGSVELVGTSVFKRQVRSIDPQAEADARVVQVRVRIDDSAEAARFVGLQVDVRIVTDR